jgi:hypothetical protein
MNNLFSSAIGFLLLHIFIPIALIVWICLSKPRSKAQWGLNVSLACSAIIAMYLIGIWSIVSLYSRYLMILLLLLGIVVSSRRLRQLPRFSRSRWFILVPKILLLLLFANVLIGAVRGFFYSGTAVDLAFPFKGGRYYVGAGGNSPYLSHHYFIKAVNHGVDFGKLNSRGMGADGLYPAAPEQYEIFGEEIFSPCAGKIVFARDGAEDHEVRPPQPSDGDVGNALVIQGDGFQVFLAHLKKGSLRVALGESVQVGQLLAQVGNSGPSFQPHLHIHAQLPGPDGSVWNGTGVPVLFDGRYLVRNSTVRAP